MRRSSRAIIAAALLALATASSAVAGPSVVLHPDGAVVETELPARNSLVECKLPAGIKDGSLRIVPVGGALIDRVEVVADDSKAVSKKIQTLRERRRQVEDRIKALDTKEEIFTAAAKSQSGKAPRKTKANPEPMAAIRQGTQYAISQLEEVYRARRLAQADLGQVDAELGSVSSVGKGATARIWLKGKSGRVRVGYFLSESRWRPVYDLRASAGASVASLIVRAALPAFDKDAAVSVVVGGEAVPVGMRRQTLPEVKRHDVQVVVAETGTGPLGSFAISLINTTGVLLPAGDVSCYVDGVFVGKAAFPAASPGEKIAISGLR